MSQTHEANLPIRVIVYDVNGDPVNFGGGGGGDVNVLNFPDSYPLPADQVLTLTPPAAIIGFATEAKQNTIISGLEVLAKSQATASSLSNVEDSATSVTLLSANSDRKGAIIYNDSDYHLFVKFGATASTTSFTVRVPNKGGFYELPQPVYTGVIDGIWEADSSGFARITELT